MPSAQSSDLDATIATRTEIVDLDESMQNLGSADNDEGLECVRMLLLQVGQSESMEPPVTCPVTQI